MKRGFQNDIVVALAFHRRKKQMKKKLGKKVKYARFLQFDLCKENPRVLTENGLFFVPQDYNPPNAPQI